MIQLGKIEIKNPYIMAPLAGITDSSFRIIAEEFGGRVPLASIGQAPLEASRTRSPHFLCRLS